jgi:hypothetical protein
MVFFCEQSSLTCQYWRVNQLESGFSLTSQDEPLRVGHASRGPFLTTLVVVGMSLENKS